MIQNGSLLTQKTIVTRTIDSQNKYMIHYITQLTLIYYLLSLCFMCLVASNQQIILKDFQMVFYCLLLILFITDI